MTGMPASRVGLKDRGLIRKDMCADITIFNPSTVIDRATFEIPESASRGSSVCDHQRPDQCRQRKANFRASGASDSRTRLAGYNDPRIFRYWSSSNALRVSV
jgi:hypothetical protein